MRIPITLYRSSFNVTPIDRRPLQPLINPVSITNPLVMHSAMILVMVACFRPERWANVAREQTPLLPEEVDD